MYDVVDAQFEKQFLNNEFRYDCGICEIWWYPNDLKKAIGKQLDLLH